MGWNWFYENPWIMIALMLSYLTLIFYHGRQPKKDK